MFNFPPTMRTFLRYTRQQFTHLFDLNKRVRKTPLPPYHGVASVSEEGICVHPSFADSSLTGTSACVGARTMKISYKVDLLWDAGQFRAKKKDKNCDVATGAPT